MSNSDSANVFENPEDQKLATLATSTLARSAQSKQPLCAIQQAAPMLR